MQSLTQEFDEYSTQYYVLTPRDRARMKTLLAPMPLRATEAMFKTALHNSFMGQRLNLNSIETIQFCAFKHALAIVRHSHHNDDDTAPTSLHWRRLQAYKARCALFDLKYAAWLSPLTDQILKDAGNRLDKDRLEKRSLNEKLKVLGLKCSIPTIMRMAFTLACADAGLKRMEQHKYDSLAKEMLRDRSALAHYMRLQAPAVIDKEGKNNLLRFIGLN